MNMEHNEYLNLKNQLQNEFDGRYVSIDECDKNMNEERDKISSLTVEFAKSNTKLNILIAILSVVSVPIVSVCIKLLFGS